MSHLLLGEGCVIIPKGHHARRSATQETLTAPYAVLNIKQDVGSITTQRAKKANMRPVNGERIAAKLQMN